MARGLVPALTVVVVLLLPSITVTLLLPVLATYNLLVTGLTATATGMIPVLTVAVKVCPLATPAPTARVEKTARAMRTQQRCIGFPPLSRPILPPPPSPMGETQS